MAKNRYDPKPVNELMGKWSKKLDSFSDKTSNLKRLQEEVERSLGPILSKKCRVANYREGTLIIEAVSATLATRLNYLKSDMLSHLRKAGFVECCQIKITSNPNAQQRLSEPRSKKATPTTYRVMSDETAEQLKALAEHAPGKLQEKLLKLAAHAKGNRQKK